MRDKIKERQKEEGKKRKKKGSNQSRQSPKSKVQSQANHKPQTTNPQSRKGRLSPITNYPVTWRYSRAQEAGLVVDDMTCVRDGGRWDDVSDIHPPILSARVRVREHVTPHVHRTTYNMTVGFEWRVASEERTCCLCTVRIARCTINQSINQSINQPINQSPHHHSHRA